jgi:hypothetical protein
MIIGLKGDLMADEFIERIFKNSEKAKLIEELTSELEDHDKAIVILIKDKEESRYGSLVMTLGLNTTYEAYGILEVAKQDLQKEEY